MTYYALPLATPRSAQTARREMDRLFEEVFTGRPGAGWQPPVDAREDATGYTIDLDLPGVSPESIEVLAEDGVLTVRGNRPNRELADQERVVFSEQRHGTFVRRFRLPKVANLEGVSATYTQGVLQVRIAKIAPTQPRRVQVTVNGTGAAPAATPSSAATEITQN